MQKTVKLCPAVSYYPSMACAISRILLFIISYACNDYTSMADTIDAIMVFSVSVHLVCIPNVHNGGIFTGFDKPKKTPRTQF